LRLRPVAAADLDALHALLIHPEVRRSLLAGEIVSRDFVARTIASSESAFARRSCGLYTVLGLDDDLLLGMCGFQSSGVPPERQLVYALAPAVRGRGYASEAVRAVVASARAAGLTSIIAATDAANAASIAVLRACGFTPVVEVVDRGRAVVRYAL
jgi:RimJ/RimL family protein N-acetyltransferase